MGSTRFIPLLYTLISIIIEVYILYSIYLYPPNNLREILKKVPQNRSILYINLDTTSATPLHTLQNTTRL